MIRRLFFILIAATQIAALPVSIDPPTAEIGMPLTVSISLPSATTTLVGLPDLGSFALLEPPKQNDKRFTIRLLPLRSGDQTLPSFSFQSGQRREATNIIVLTVEATEIPETPHPLRPFPETAGQNSSSERLIPLFIGFAILMLLLILALRYRRPNIGMQTGDPQDPFSLLARAVHQARIHTDPDWEQLCRQIDRVRFGPLPHSNDELEEFEIEFARLKGEAS